MIELIKFEVVTRCEQLSSNFAVTDELDKLLLNNVLMAKSIQAYVRREPAMTMRKIYHYLYLVFYFVYTCKWAFLMKYQPGEIFLAEIGEFSIFYLTKTNFLYTGLFYSELFILLTYLITHYLKVSHQLFALEMVYNIKLKVPGYALEEKFEKKLATAAFIIGRTFTLCFYYLVIPGLFVIISSLGLIAYIFGTTKYNWIALILNCLGAFLSLRHSTCMGMIVALGIYIVIKFVQYKVIIIIQMISSSSLLVQSAMVHYNKLYKITKRNSKLFNWGMSALYLIFPFIFRQILKIPLDRQTSTGGKIIAIYYLIIIVLGNLIVFYFPSTISTTNTKILKCLYPIVVDNNINNTKLKRRIDSFIARLNTEFIGFKCLNIKFKQINFFKYIMAITSAFFKITAKHG